MSPKRQQRTTAEWVTFAVSVLVLVIVAGAITLEARGHHTDAQPVAVVGETRRVGSHYQVEVTLRNRGDKAAASVQVIASLEVGGDTTDADQVVDFLAGGDAQDLVFVFPDDPARGQLDVTVGSFSVP